MNALSHRKQQKGAVLVLVTIALFTLLGFTALALDGGYLLLNKTRVQDAVDSAALSGAKTLSKTAANGNTHADARAAVFNTLQTVFAGDGFSQVDIDLTKQLTVEFSHQAVPFQKTNDTVAKFIRVRLDTVPVNQFFSQLLIDKWQVASSAVAGPEKGGKPVEQQVIPLLLCSKDTSDDHHGFTPSDKDDRGDVIVVKTNHHKDAPVGSGNFLALSLDRDGDGKPDTGADDFAKALSGDLNVNSVIKADDMLTTEPGNMVGKTSEGLNTRFGKDKHGKNISGPSADPGTSEAGAYYSDCAIPDFSNPVTFNDLDFGGDVSAGGNLVLQKGSNKWSGLQSFPDYYDGIHSKSPSTNHCIDERRIVKLPVANCDGNTNGRSTITVIDTVCMFLNQEVTGQGNNQYIVAEMLESCDLGGGSSGGSTSERLVLYKDTASGDS